MTNEELVDVLEDVINQACRGEDGVLDSMCLTAYADGMRTLASLGRLEIMAEHGRRVVGRWPAEERP